LAGLISHGLSSATRYSRKNLEALDFRRNFSALKGIENT
jgi:hypothetical protein